MFEPPTGGAWRYRPVFSGVILTFGVLEGLRSLFPGFGDRGSLREAEAAIWIPTVAESKRAGGYVGDHLALFMPYVSVDDAIGLSSGREIYGVPKTEGWMDSIGGGWSASGPLPEPPDRLTLEVVGGNRGTAATLKRQPAGDDQAPVGSGPPRGR